MEVEILRLRAENRLLSQEQEVRFLAESMLPSVDVETSEKQVVENPEEGGN